MRVSPQWLWLSLLLAACSGENNNVGPVCGDGTLDSGEQCDDGNTVDGDGCSAVCEIAPLAVCGNGTREFGEQCDDGNTSNGDGCDAQCLAESPSGASAAQLEAFAIVNELRASADLPALALEPTINSSAQSHADYFGLNASFYNTGASPHVEDPAFPNGFTGVQFFDRMDAAGFAGSPFSEVIAFANEPNFAIDLWVNSVFHRVPFLHPNTGAMGYGGAAINGRSIDVIDFGARNPEDPNQIVLFPAPNSTGNHASFSGNEGPQPPAPPDGSYPSGPLVSVIFARNADANLTRIELFDANNNSLPVTVVGPDTPGLGAFMLNSFCFYSNGPAPSGSTLRAVVEGTVNGVAFTRDWTFSVE